MNKPTKSTDSAKYGKHTAFIIGFLFIILGSSTQAETSWLFTVGGLLALIQGLFDHHKEKIKHR